MIVQYSIECIFFMLYHTDRRTASSLVGQYESFRRKQGEEKGGGFLRHGSLERQRSGGDKRTSWIAPDEVANFSNFRPVTLTLSSFFKQVRQL